MPQSDATMLAVYPKFGTAKLFKQIAIPKRENSFYISKSFHFNSS